MPFTPIAPDVIIEELIEPNGETLVTLGLKSRELSGRQVQLVATFASRYSRVAGADLFALVLAKEEQCILVTCDARLRKAAENEKIEVHGTLWVLDQMISNGVLTRFGAKRALKRMIDKGSRFPHDKVEECFKKWGT